jgi:hypothetical protein
MTLEAVAPLSDNAMLSLFKPTPWQSRPGRPEYVMQLRLLHYAKGHNRGQRQRAQDIEILYASSCSLRRRRSDGEAKPAGKSPYG